MEPDFSGWATKYGVPCTDGRTIMDGAFAHMDGKEVPLVWSHKHDDPELVLGHGALTNKPGEGLWVDAYFNDNPKAVATKELVRKKNVNSLSIWANRLVEKMGAVTHGALKEVSVVLAGANSGAKIQNVSIAHGDYETTLDDTVIIHAGYQDLVVHSGADEEVETTEVNAEVAQTKETTQVETGAAAASKEAADTNTPDSNEGGDEEELEHGEAPTAEEVTAFFESLPADKQNIVEHMVGAAYLTGTTVEHSDTNTNDEGTALTHQEGSDNMTRKLFENGAGAGSTLAHDALGATPSDAFLSHGDTIVVTNTDKGYLTHDDLGSLATAVHSDVQGGVSFKSAILAHAQEYGITNIEVLFPDAKMIDSRPEWITRKMEWVEEVLNGARKVPWQKIKTMSADLTHEEARAKGYIKATMKKEQFFELRGRETGPQTIYKKQRLDRDDIIDAGENFDVVAWLWVEMRFMLREEFARAILIGDGRPVEDPENAGQPNPEKIKETHIRPIAYDDPFYTDVITVAANVNEEYLVEAVVRGRERYEGTNPIAFMTQATMTDMLLAKDRMGRRLYRTRAELAQEMEVEKIVTVPVMKDAEHDNGLLLMVIVNMSDYAIGQTRGGEITTFEDFDIDWNQHKYLIETRGSGALLKHKRAQVVVRASGTEVVPEDPTFDNATGVVTIPATANVVYLNAETGEELSAGAQNALPIGGSLYVEADPAEGYFFPGNTQAEWGFTRTPQ